MEPESNHTSITAETRRIRPLHFPQGSVTRSMYGRCRSASSVRPSSATEPTQRRSSHFSQTQIGNGVPQYRQRESDQSTTVSSQLPMRPDLMYAGTQFTALLLRSSWSLTAVVLMNHEVNA